MTRTPFLAANWKMYKTVQEAVVYAKELRSLVKDLTGVEVIIAPPFTAVHGVAEASRNTIVTVAGQDVHWEREGAFTGEISATMLKEAGAEAVVIGHSERRRLFAETDEIVNRKITAVLQAGLYPIFCIGETLEEREGGQTLDVLDRQVKVGLDGVSAEHVADLVVAYEPVWAIGTGRNATPEQAGEAHTHIRGRIRQWFGADAAERCHVIYGGSVKPDNVAALAALPDIDGALVGGASLDVRAFVTIVTNFKAARRS
jgi:triosephosphate isomerase (TIM)